MKQTTLREILSKPDAPATLLSKTLALLHASLIRRLRNQFVVALLATTAVSSFAIHYWNSAYTEVSESSFGSLVRLSLSDPDVIFVNMKDVLLGIFESLPVGVLLMTLVFSFFFLGTIGLVLRLREERSLQNSASLSFNNSSRIS